MKKFMDDNIDFTKNILSFQTLVLFQLYKTLLWISNMSESQDVEIVERHLRAFKELLRPDKDYKQALSILNEEYEEKVKNMPQTKVKSLDLQIDYAMEHFGILMELLKRKGYVILAKGAVLFEGLADFKGKI